MTTSYETALCVRLNYRKTETGLFKAVALAKQQRVRTETCRCGLAEGSAIYALLHAFDSSIGKVLKLGFNLSSNTGG